MTESIPFRNAGFCTAAVEGFTLVELAIAMFVIALLLGGLLVPLATQVEQRRISDTQKYLEEIKEALIGFAVANSYLPCPDTTGDGVADPTTPGVCFSAEGFVPWATLNVAPGDAWGNRFRYRVSPEFTNTPASGACSSTDGRIGLCDTGNITVSTRTASKATQSIGIKLAAVIISLGKNGYGATSTSGDLRTTVPPVNVDEATNANPARTTFMSRTFTAASDSTLCSDTDPAKLFCEFDDMVTWLSTFTLFNRMIAAGRLP